MKNIYHNFYRKIIFNASALMHHPLLFMVPVVQTVLLSLLQKVAKKGKYKLISVPPMVSKRLLNSIKL